MNSTTQKALKGESGRERAIAEICPRGAAPAGKPEVGGATSAGKPDWRAALPEAERRVLVLDVTPEQVAAIKRILCQAPPAGGHTKSEIAALAAALRGVIKQPGQRGQAERAFAEHLRTHLRIGLECLHSEPEGRIWS